MWTRLPVNYPLFLLDFNETWIFLKIFKKKAHLSSIIKIRPVGAELLHADGQTDTRMDGRDEANSRFSQFCERA
jgi:hypothetical protein